MTLARLELSLEAQRDACEAARAAVLEFLKPHGIDGEPLFHIELVLEEVLMNVIWHAFKDQAEHHVDLCVEVESDVVVIRLTDDGISFDPTAAALPVLPISIESAVPGGLGLMLVRKLARAVEYERRDGRNHLAVTIARTGAAG